MKNLYQFKSDAYVSNIYESEETCKSVALSYAGRRNKSVAVYKFEYFELTKSYNFRELIAQY